jgi:two-component system nitrogen regulation sensor histidine kinase GlnL
MRTVKKSSIEFCEEIFDGLVTSVIWVDSAERVQYLNVAAGELFQMSQSRLQGKPWSALLPGLLSDIGQATEKRVTIHEYSIDLPDLYKIRVSCTISPCELKGNKGWLFEIYNTERHHRIVEEDERWHQYEAGNLLIKTLAHEVKNPLAGILGATQLLQKRHEPGDRDLAFLEIISKEVLRLTNLVDSMLGPKSGERKELHNIHELIRYVLKIIKGEQPSNIYIKLDYDPSIPEILMDFEAMVQALLNLIKNALQAMEKHGGFLTIKTRVEHKFTLGTQTYPLVAVISLIDEGEGIPDSIMDSIFYPMVTSKEQGTGLGLPVSQNVLRKHDGLIVAESKPGLTVFNVYLPLKQRE